MAMQLFAEQMDPDGCGYPVLTVYDSVLLDVKYDWLNKQGGKAWVRDVMVNQVPKQLKKQFDWTIDVPLDVDVEISRAWAS
jgi:hypothetical protein